MPVADIWPPIHSIVVVTSPMGDQAPPAFAAITTIPTKYFRVSLLLINLRSKVTITIDVVKLSKTADMKKVIKPTIHSSLITLSVFINRETKWNPWWASTNSTKVIAPSKKNKISEVDAK